MLDEYIVRHAPGPSVDAYPSIASARASLAGAMLRLRDIPESAMESPWQWIAGEADIRYGFYRLYEILEGARAAVTGVLPRADASEARSTAQAANEARWELQGLLATLDDVALDADPGGGEWTLRQTLAHTIHTQRAYAWVTAWWLSRREESEIAERWPESELALLPDEVLDGSGDLAEVRARLDDIVDVTSARYATLPAADLIVRGRWSGLPLTVGFRLWRCSSHMREHTIQMDKTLPWIERAPTEVDRLVRLISSAYGRLEALLFCVEPTRVEQSGVDGRSAAELLKVAMSEVESIAESVGDAAALAATG